LIANDKLDLHEKTRVFSQQSLSTNGNNTVVKQLSETQRNLKGDFIINELVEPYPTKDQTC